MATTTLRCALLLVCLWLAGCSSARGVGSGSAGPEARTPAAIIEAQSELYAALFEEPPDYRAASGRMSRDCRAKSPDPENVVGEVYTEVELARSIDLDLAALLGAFSQVSYTIEDNEATGDDGSVWLYEDGSWHSEDC